jgi:hypothetical protein
MGKTQILGSLVNTILTDSSNNVGIGGAANASFKLRVTGSSAGDSVYAIGDGASSGGALKIKQYASSAANEDGYSTISTLNTGVFYFTSASTSPNFKNFVLNPSGLTDNTLRTYTLPNASGTLALTSALSAYLPLTGGTLTGPLSGTSASFSSTITATDAVLTKNGDITIKFNPNNVAKWDLYYNNADGTIGFYDRVGSAFRMTLAQTGAAAFSSSVNVNGLATSVNYKLGVTGAAFISGANNKGLFITDSASFASIVGLNSALSAYNAIELRASGTDYQLYLSTNGNVGIGTNSPTERFEVAGLNGNIRIYGRSGICSNSISANLYYNGSAWVRDNASYGASAITFDSSNDAIIFRTTAATSGDTTERMRITSGGYLKASNNGTYSTTIPNSHQFSQSLSNSPVIISHAQSNDYVSETFYANVVRAANVGYGFFAAASGNFDDLEFKLYGDGNGKCDGSWTGGGADYAEYFEWFDGNINNEDRRGYSVSLIENKIKIAEKGENIIGVISGNPSIVGDAAWNKWSGKYLRDDFGSYILDENGDRTLSSNYNEDIEYIPRDKRPEWSIVGLMGKLRIRKGQATMPTWIKMRDVSENVEEWLIK